MSNLTVSGIYGTFTYSLSNLYTYLGSVPQSSQELKNAFDEYNISCTGTTNDLQKLERAIYQEYSQQVQTQMQNQNEQNTVPWASVCEQIGVPVTGDKEKDYAAFNEAIALLGQSAIDGQAQTYFAGLKTEAQSVFNMTKNAPQVTSYYDYRTHFDWRNI